MRTTRASDVEFAEAGSCARCHAEAQARWHGSHHDLAMQPATSETVLGDFDDAELVHFGETTRFHREGGRFRVDAPLQDGATKTFEVAYTFGVEPLQQYLLAFPKGRLQSLTIAWDTRREVWFSLYPDEAIPPGDPLHWSGPLQRWNSMCADCHSTAFERGYDVASATYASEYVTLDVSCQACHGPAARHVAWAKSLVPGRQVSPSADRHLPALADEVQVCAPCHSRRHRVSGRAVPGEPFLDHYVPELLRTGLYHPDGQIQDEVYVYGSFVQSRMFDRGVRCSDCHEPHALGLRAEGNALCTRCHGLAPDPRFPTLTAKVYDSREHHFHREGSPGARCVSCHMPAKTYMQVDDRRDHSLRVPRPDLSLRLGTPNACTGCHVDREDAWAADVLESRGAPTPPHFGETLAAARLAQPGSVTALALLAANRDAPAIARATALAMLVGPASSGDPDLADVLLAASGDASGLLRLVAGGGLEAVRPARSVPTLAKLVSGPLRAVRAEAARVLSGVREPELTAAQSRAYAAALDEYRAGQIAQNDTPEAHLNLGVLSARRGLPGAAEKSFRAAIGLEPDFVPARVNLANLLNALGRNDEAVSELEAAIASHERLSAFVPDGPGPRSRGAELQYSLGLVLAEAGDLDGSARALGEAARVLRDRPRVQYNHGLALQRLGRLDEAEQALLRADALAPGSPDLQNALAILYFRRGDRERAISRAERFLETTGGAPAAVQLLERIKAGP